MARPKRFELLTPRFVVWCSIQLSYGRFARRPGNIPAVGAGLSYRVQGILASAGAPGAGLANRAPGRHMLWENRANGAGEGGVRLSVATSAASAVYGFGRSGADGRRGGGLPAVFARRGRPGLAAPAHLGSRHGAVAGNRGWLRHRGRDRL